MRLAGVAGAIMFVLGALAAAADAASGWTAYVANYGGNVVTRFSTSSNVTFGTAIPVGAGPQAVAITPDGSTAYIANASGNSVTPINLATNTAGTAIPVGAAPIAVAITPDGSTAYVTNDGDNSVTPIDTDTNTPETAIPVGASPEGIAITPDGRTAYVTSNLDDSVTPIDLATDTPGTPISVALEPEGIAIVPDQAPAAAFSTVAEPAGQPSSFDGSASASPVGSIAHCRIAHHRCVAPTAGNRRHARCNRLTAIRGRLTKVASAGANALTLTGRLDGGALAPGSYRLTITAQGAPPARRRSRSPTHLDRGSFLARRRIASPSDPAHVGLTTSAFVDAA